MAQSKTKQEEVDRNFAFFQGELPKLMATHAGKFALLRDQKIIGYFDTISDANTAGQQQFSDGLFSIQQIKNNPTDLGFYSHAVHLGAV